MISCHSRKSTIYTAALLATFTAFAPGLAGAEEHGARFEIGAGPRLAPAYEGADEYVVSPGVTGSLDALSFGFVNIRPDDGTGFGIAPSFRYLAERSAKDHRVLDGIEDVDAALELGAKLKYGWRHAELFGAVRKGVTGHDGAVAELGADAILRPDARTTLRAGPRLSLANQSYMDSYFSVPGTATALAPHDEEAGMKSAGIGLSLRRELSEAWAVEGSLGWDRLTGSVARSPIVKEGSRDQGSVGLMLIRKFDLRF